MKPAYILLGLYAVSAAAAAAGGNVSMCADVLRWLVTEWLLWLAVFAPFVTWGIVAAYYHWRYADGIEAARQFRFGAFSNAPR